MQLPVVTWKPKWHMMNHGILIYIYIYMLHIYIYYIYIYHNLTYIYYTCCHRFQSRISMNFSFNSPVNCSYLYIFIPSLGIWGPISQRRVSQNITPRCQENHQPGHTSWASHQRLQSFTRATKPTFGGQRGTPPGCSFHGI